MLRSTKHLAILFFLLVATTATTWRVLAFPPGGGYPIDRASFPTEPTQGNDLSFSPSVSPQGEYVAFTSVADNLVAGDNNGNNDVFVRHIDSGLTERVSVSSTGDGANGDSGSPDISGENGRWVVFASEATNFGVTDTNGGTDIFLRDRTNDTTTLVSGSSATTAGNDPSDSPHITPNGNYVVFRSDATNLVGGDTNGDTDCFIYTRSGGAISRILTSTAIQLNGDCFYPDISAGTPMVVYATSATNVLPGDLNGTDLDIYLVSLTNTGHTRVSVDSAGNQANDDALSPSVSSNGDFVAFWSAADNLVPNDTNGSADVFVHEVATGITTRVSVSSTGAQANSVSAFPTISSGGRYVAFLSFASNLVSGDTNGVGDIFVHDRQTGTTVRVSTDATGVQGDDHAASSAISGDGNFVALDSEASNLVPDDDNGVADVFRVDISSILRNPQGGFPIDRASLSNTESEGNDESNDANVSFEGRFVGFASEATNLVPNDSNGNRDVFVRDLNTRTTERVSVTNAGGGGNGASYDPDLSSSNARYVVFESLSSNFATDSNGVSDIFMRDRVSDTTTLVSESLGGTTGNGISRFPAITPDGDFTVFSSLASDIVAGDTNAQEDCFVRDNAGGSFNRVLTWNGGQVNDNCSRPDISGGTPIIAFESTATNLIPVDANGSVSDIFIVSIFNTNLELVSVNATGDQANGSSHYASVAANGNFVAFMSFASNLVSGDTNGRADIFVKDMTTGEVDRVSVATDGTQGDFDALHPAISNNGRYITFSSLSTTLVPDDDNFATDIFVHDRQTGITTRVSTHSSGIEGNGISDEPSISGDGNFVGFASEADNLVPDDLNEVSDVFRVQIGGVPPTPTPTATPTNTPPPTATATGTVTPPTATPTGTITPPTTTPTGTITPPTNTPTSTVTPTGTITPPTATPTGTMTPPTMTPTGTITPPTATPTGTITPPPANYRLYLPLIDG
jgi:hypothetical protein